MAALKIKELKSEQPQFLILSSIEGNKFTVKMVNPARNNELISKGVGEVATFTEKMGTLTQYPMCVESELTPFDKGLYIHSVSVQPKYKGRGLSKILMAEILKHAAKLELPPMLTVHSTNVKAKNLYVGLGFKVLGKRMSSLWMAKE